MKEIQIFKNEDLVLKVNPIYNPKNLNLIDWENFLDLLCGDRKYQKEAIKTSIIFLAGKNYNNIEELVKENYKENIKLQEKYLSLSEVESKLQIKNKLFANIDLATGTGKSYVIYGIAQIMLGIGLVDQVLVLCPSLTIESGLKEKFEKLSSDRRIKKSLPNTAIIKNPRIIDANVTIKKGDICIENIHVIYERTGSSINDSLKNKGKRTLILNDESHHIFNESIDKDIKKWKNFLLSKDYNFNYIIGFTGTAYIKNDYFNDVIYRYSLKKAIEENIVKNIDYIQKDDSSNINEKFQKIYQNHLENQEKYPLIKPLTILITKDISKAKNLMTDLIDFLVVQESLNKEIIEKKVLIITSHSSHKINIEKLKNIDDKNNPYEWIISISMLTEGWDVKNVFQIVPWEDKAFNSKLLIAQVLGRGLRIPIQYSIPQPKVIVFNHDSWSRNIKGLVEEILEIEVRLCSRIITEGNRSKYNFEVYNLNYNKINKEITNKNCINKEYDYSRIITEGISLESQVININKETTYESLKGDLTERKYDITYKTDSIENIIDKIYNEFNIREWEGKILQLGKEKYTKNNLPPRNIIKAIIQKSMERVGINGEQLVEKNKIKILQAFGTFLRKKNKTVIIKPELEGTYSISTLSISAETISVNSIRREAAIFFSTNFKNELNFEQGKIIESIKNDDYLPRRAFSEINDYYFKTPLDLVFAASEAERNFIIYLCKEENSSLIDSWIKSRNMGFYSIEYTWRRSNHQINQFFNPDFFIKVIKNNILYYIVIEIKSDKDDSEENKAKYKYAKKHFKNLNKNIEREGIKHIYIFHFLSPDAYVEFFDYLRKGTLLEGKFKCQLENLLEE